MNKIVWDQIVYGRTSDGGIAKGLDDSAFSQTYLTVPTSILGIPVVGIADGAFVRCDMIEKAILSPRVTSVGACAFAFCYSLREVWLPDSVTHIGEEAFSYCMNLQTCVLPKHMDTIGFLAFARCDALSLLVLPETCRKQAARAFYDAGNQVDAVRVWVPEGMDTQLLSGLPGNSIFYCEGGPPMRYVYHTKTAIPIRIKRPVMQTEIPRLDMIRTHLGRAYADAYRHPWEEVTG